MRYLKNVWSVAAWSHEVAAGQLLARTLLEQPVLLWRDSEGTPVAFRDACPHRGAPLSLGRCERDVLHCAYHGLSFDRSGRCVGIPGQAHIPTGLRVPAWPVVERYGWLWIWMGDPLRADSSLIPHLPWLDDPAWHWKPGYMRYAANHLLVADNLCDFSHLAFLHAGSIGGGSSYASDPPQLERLKLGIRVTRWILDAEPAAFQRFAAGVSGPVDRWNIYDFLVPGLLLLDTGCAPAGTGAPEGVRRNAFESRGVQAITPETAGSTHYFFAQPHNGTSSRERVTDASFEVLLKAFAEDRRVLEEQQARLDMINDFKPAPIAVDAGLAHYRRTLQALIDAELEGP